MTDGTVWFDGRDVVRTRCPRAQPVGAETAPPLLADSGGHAVARRSRL